MSEKIGSFQVLGELGTGAHSTILHIRRNSDLRAYALKVVKIDDAEDEKYLDQAEHEYDVAQKLDHPNLIKIYLFEKIKTLGFFGKVKECRSLIEYVHGQTLDKFKIIPVHFLLQIFHRVAEGMVMMHRRGICHGDLKPNNIMLSRTGEVKVIDYGLSWVAGQQKGRIQGTPEYMAPEQISRKIVNEQTDIFNFGATLYRLLTFRHIPKLIAPDGSSIPVLEEGWYAVLKPVLSINPKCPEKLADLVEKCIAYKPMERFSTMSEVSGKLERMCQKGIDEAHELKNWEWAS